MNSSQWQREKKHNNTKTQKYKHKKRTQHVGSHGSSHAGVPWSHGPTVLIGPSICWAGMLAGWLVGCAVYFVVVFGCLEAFDFKTDYNDGLIVLCS